MEVIHCLSCMRARVRACVCVRTNEVLLKKEGVYGPPASLCVACTWERNVWGPKKEKETEENT